MENFYKVFNKGLKSYKLIKDSFLKIIELYLLQSGLKSVAYTNSYGIIFYLITELKTETEDLEEAFSLINYQEDIRSKKNKFILAAYGIYFCDYFNVNFEYYYTEIAKELSDFLIFREEIKKGTLDE